MAIEFDDIMKDYYSMLQVEPYFGAVLKAASQPLAISGLTTTMAKLAVNTTNFDITAEGGWTFDNANNRWYWDSADNYSMSLKNLFIGAAGLSLTSGTATATITLYLVKNGVTASPIIVTPEKFGVLDATQSYDASVRITAAQGDYFEVYAATDDAGGNNITMNYFNISNENR